jgi:hypothetical protein
LLYSGRKLLRWQWLLLRGTECKTVKRLFERKGGARIIKVSRPVLLSFELR